MNDYDFDEFNYDLEDDGHESGFISPRVGDLARFRDDETGQLIEYEFAEEGRWVEI